MPLQVFELSSRCTDLFSNRAIGVIRTATDATILRLRTEFFDINQQLKSVCAQPVVGPATGILDHGFYFDVRESVGAQVLLQQGL